MECDWLIRGPVAQRIRASDYGSEGREFESLQARFKTARKGSFFLFVHIKAKTLIWGTNRWKFSYYPKAFNPKNEGSLLTCD